MKNKIALLTTFIILVSLLITMNVIFHESLRSDFAEIYNKQQVLVSKGISSSIETAIDREVGELKFLSGILSEYPIDDREKIKEIIKANFNIKHKFKTEITLINSTRDILFSTRPTGKQDKYFEKVEKLNLREVGIFHDMERVYAIAPIFRKGLYVGGILLEIKIKDIAVQFLSPFKSMQKGSVWLMDGDGNLFQVQHWQENLDHLCNLSLYRSYLGHGTKHDAIFRAGCLDFCHRFSGGLHDRLDQPETCQA